LGYSAFTSRCVGVSVCVRVRVRFGQLPSCLLGGPLRSVTMTARHAMPRHILWKGPYAHKRHQVVEHSSAAALYCRLALPGPGHIYRRSRGGWRGGWYASLLPAFCGAGAAALVLPVWVGGLWWVVCGCVRLCLAVWLSQQSSRSSKAVAQQLTRRANT
jgi:hypothetical protein